MAADFSPPKIAQVGINCDDLVVAEAFCDALGLTRIDRLGDSLFVSCGEVNLIIQASPTPKVPGNMIYFSADGRVHEATTALQARGVTFKQPPRRIASDHLGFDIWLGFFDDPWGNPLALLANMPVEA
jgi:hypothetical protein